MEENNNNIQFSTIDPLHNQIILKEGTWRYKILNIMGSDVNCHKEMENHLDDIEKTISNPMFIQQDTTMDNEGNVILSNNRAEYYKLFFCDDGLKAIKAVVEYSNDIVNYNISESKGEVVTAHFCENNKIKSVKGVNLYDSSEK